MNGSAGWVASKSLGVVVLRSIAVVVDAGGRLDFPVGFVQAGAVKPAGRHGTIGRSHTGLGKVQVDAGFLGAVQAHAFEVGLTVQVVPARTAESRTGASAGDGNAESARALLIAGAVRVGSAPRGAPLAVAHLY